MMKKIQKAAMSLVLVFSLVAGPCTNAFAASTGGDSYQSLKDSDALLSREAAAQGMVLLENKDSALPIPNGQTVALFGSGQINFVKGGTGSGNVNVDYVVNLLQGMQNKQEAGEISVYKPLADAYTSYISGGGKGEMPLKDSQVSDAAKDAQTAVVTISRISGEGSDRTAAKGDYYLSNDEVSMLDKVTSAGFQKVAVVLNICGVIDTSWIKNYPGISVLISWLPGMEGGNAVSDVLCGDVNPSGKLADTFAKSYDDYPSSGNFTQSTAYVNYQEDIYVGYRYFETFDSGYQKVNYEFGYGLSYTTFDISNVTVTPAGDDMEITADVTNTGTAAGKEVVQTYFSAPQGRLGKPGKQLAAFAKTDLLQPGETQTVEMSYAVKDMASYDDTGKVQKSAYVLEPGDYNIYVGNSIKNAGENGIRYTYEVDGLIVAEQLKQELVPQKLNKRLLADGTYEYLPTITVQRIAAAGQSKVEAEDFSDAASPSGNTPRIETFTVGGQSGKCLAYMNYAGNTVTYDLDVGQAGTYDIVFRGSNGRSAINDMMKIYVNDVLQPGVNVVLPQTGDGSGKGEWYNFVDCAPVSVSLPVGRCSLKIECKADNQFGNLDYMTFTETGSSAAQGVTAAVPEDSTGATAAKTALSAVASAGQKKLVLLDVYKDSSLMDSFLNQLSDTQLADLLGGKRAKVPGGTGGIGDLGDYGIPSAQTSDGPAGLRLTEHATCWPCSTLQACTWDTELVKQIGVAVGKEARANNVDIWLAPGMDIHRNPLCGRNFEYYSEDPLISGKTAAALTEGVQSQGVGVTLKHFACNEKETNRTNSDSRVSERALREIYLRGFQIAVTEADPLCIMSSYNLINGTETAESRELLTDILRGEWGYTGLVMTDWGNNSIASNEVKAGNNVKMSSGNTSNILSALASGYLTRGDLERNVKYVLNMTMRTNVFQRDAVDVTPADIGPASATQIKAVDYIWCSAGIGAEVCQDADGGENPTYTGSGSWLSYQINVQRGGSYNLYPRVAGTANNSGFDIYVDDAWAGSFNQSTATGAYQSWVTGTPVPVYLSTGTHTLKLVFNNSLNLNWIRIIPGLLSPQNITAVKKCGGIFVPYGTGLEQVPLPQTVTAVLNDAQASNVALPVVWNGANSGYDPSKAGAYSISGSITLPDDGSVTNNNTLTADITVHVLPRQSADWSSLQAVLDQAGKLTKSNYTSASWNVLASAVSAAEALPATATQQQVDQAAQSIAEAIQRLVKISSGGNSGSGGSSGNSGGSGSEQPKPVTPQTTFTSDTTTDVRVNGGYVIRITSLNGEMPNIVIGTPGVFYDQIVRKTGDDYYIKLIAVGQPGAQTGIYVNGRRLFVATVQLKCDTTLPLALKQGSEYYFKISVDGTVGDAPVFTAGYRDVLQVQLVERAGRDCIFKVKAIGKPGESSGVYTTLPGRSPVLQCLVNIV